MMDVDFGDEEVRDFPHLAKPSAWAGRQAGALRGRRGPIGNRLHHLQHRPGIGEAARMVVDQRRHLGEQGILLGGECQPGDDAIVERLLGAL